VQLSDLLPRDGVRSSSLDPRPPGWRAVRFLYGPRHDEHVQGASVAGPGGLLADCKARSLVGAPCRVVVDYNGEGQLVEAAFGRPCGTGIAQQVTPLRYGKAVARISSKHQVTLPVESLKQAGLGVGDEVAIEAEGADRIVVRRVSRDAERALGIFDGLYEPGYLERLRSGERA